MASSPRPPVWRKLLGKTKGAIWNFSSKRRRGQRGSHGDVGIRCGRIKYHHLQGAMWPGCSCFCDSITPLSLANSPGWSHTCPVEYAAYFYLRPFTYALLVPNRVICFCKSFRSLLKCSFLRRPFLATASSGSPRQAQHFSLPFHCSPRREKTAQNKTYWYQPNAYSTNE